MKSVVCVVVVVAAVMVVEGEATTGGKVKRQIYYPDSQRTGQLPLSPEYPAPSGPSEYSPRPPQRPARPTYQEPARPTYQARPHSSEEYEKKNSIPGEPGVDYPIYDKIPYTKFSCSDVPYRPGIYANPEAGCQVYHVCDDDRYGPQGAQFLCTNGTLFNQEVFTCDWWYNVDCSKATSFYSLNEDPEFNPYYQKPYEGPLASPAPYADGPAPYADAPAPPRNPYYQ
ncbi:uncharacterized protein LOC126981871 [Eriocheir sinensis]|uniref:uncharacterized protein LOC126981871 n=1 Tax=Eriocheir sinensis TaxID=95602 RepID=UPI0021C6143D|nr:uncharacterized protein LOC126981871 [Eriocheir sinensis]